MHRKERHIHAKSDEWIVVHRSHPSRNPSRNHPGAPSGKGCLKKFIILIIILIIIIIIVGQ